MDQSVYHRLQISECCHGKYIGEIFSIKYILLFKLCTSFKGYVCQKQAFNGKEILRI